MIISASRRTDIPAFFTPWFMNRIRAGFCTVPNPYNSRQVSRISLRPEDVDAIVFSTRNPRPLFPHLDELDRRGFRYYFLITLVNNPRAIDPHSPSLRTAAEVIRRLAGSLGPQRVVWRYDPIVFSASTSPDYHLENFESIVRLLQGSTQRCVISILDDYRKARQRMAALQRQGYRLLKGDELEQAVVQTVPGLVQIAAQAGIEVTSCAETFNLVPMGVRPGSCIDADLLHALFGLRLSWKKDPSQRAECGCVLSRDIGMYDSCLFGCQYCYATRDFALSARNYRSHDPQSPSLLGWHLPNSPAAAGAQMRLF
ncbi:MAG: DUF1848 domain-containing protein [Chloroflexi bacterium]|jgi:hypothetical protein|nr:DUF1848 domain-containing protein [Chloroflexota bacterium]